jgi:hypothetical protein
MFAKRHRLFVLLALVLLISSCSPSAKMQGEHWVIFSEKQANEWEIGSWFAQNGETIEYWTPTEENVIAIENELTVFLQENPDHFYNSETPVWERLDEYNRQYIGVMLDDRQIIYANFFCDSVETDWRTDFVLVMDGGDCFFQFKYDVEAAQFFDLQVNGNA